MNRRNESLVTHFRLAAPATDTPACDEVRCGEQHGRGRRAPQPLVLRSVRRGHPRRGEGHDS